ncbi:MAG: hypothetical protein HYR60_18020 [Acidobacteria bacterium]|nr:hypothetical protein [Acidobacteriota bacterium]MBI3472319.1 hypothetical protein [Candidatus Solibacter usitatus]
MTRRLVLLAGVVRSLRADHTLLVRREGERLRVSAPQIRFLGGRPLEQLRNGVTVGFVSQVSLFLESQSAVASRAVDRFILSFDLWEEKFTATRMGPPSRSVSRLTAPAAEAWCLDQSLALPAGLAPRRRFSIRLELRAEDPRETAAVASQSGISITRLIELFSRPPRSQQPRWTAGAGPLRLEELP